MRGRGDRAGAWGCPESLRDDTGLMHVGARYYDAQVRRFTTRDTVLSEHPYLYCEHDAVNAVEPSGCDWYYDIGSGRISRHVGKKTFYVGIGYSGRPGYRNDPGSVHLHDLGPIPPGGYTIGAPRNHGRIRYGLPLNPDSDNEMYDRSGFWIHGDNPWHDASSGCIILPRTIRERIWRSGDRRLIVQ